MGVKRNATKRSQNHTSSNAKRFAPAPNYKCTNRLSFRWCSFQVRLPRPFLKTKKRWALSNFDSFSTMRKQSQAYSNTFLSRHVARIQVLLQLGTCKPKCHCMYININGDILTKNTCRAAMGLQCSGPRVYMQSCSEASSIHVELQ